MTVLIADYMVPVFTGGIMLALSPFAYLINRAKRRKLGLTDPPRRRKSKQYRPDYDYNNSGDGYSGGWD